MAQVLTKNQVGLIGYLKEIGCDKNTIVNILLDVWDEKAIIEMLEFCRENHPANSTELLKMSSKSI